MRATTAGEPMTEPTCPSPRTSPLRGLLHLVWKQALWAIPFALFFGLLYGDRGLGVFWLTFKMSLIFSYAIGIGLWTVRHFVEPPPSRAAAADDMSVIWRIGTAYTAAALIASYAAAFIIHFTVLPGFMGSLRAVVVSGLFMLLFSALFAGISFAVAFYRKAVERARAVETMRAELAEAELRAVRAQINPHFLFNTLNSIAALIRMDPAAAEDATTRLADVFRYALRASDDGTARLADELAFLRAYLSLEQTRFGDRLRVTERIEPGLDGARVPSLLLQPIVENAVRYAVSPRAEGGRIEVAVRRDGALLRLSVADDGPGFDAEAEAAGTGFGLHSVRERLRAAGPPHAVEIHTSRGSGTRIDIVLPLHLQPHAATPQTGAMA
jgi:signal transduction histidine kinase